MSQARADNPTTIREFDEFVEPLRGDTQFELVAGRIVMMTNPSENHEQIAGNIGAPLKFAMDRRGCRAYQGGMRVQRSEDGRGLDKPRSDIVVRCGPASNRHFVTDPLVIVEVLSPSTMDEDRGDKLRFYKSLPTVLNIVLVYQNSVRVEHYRRVEQAFELDTLHALSDRLVFESVGFEIALDDVYFGVLFEGDAD